MAMDKQTEQLSLAKGAPLSQATWDDFVTRLRYDCEGERVRDHGTANATFIVEARYLVYGLDQDYSDDLLVQYDDGKWFSPQEYWDDNEDMHEALNKLSQDDNDRDFLEIDSDSQWEILKELEDHNVTAYQWEWWFVSAHLTHDAAQAFIDRNNHNYRNGLRVYVDSTYYSWELNAIKSAILNGELTYTPRKTNDAGKH
jgi:hypothetical protein